MLLDAGFLMQAVSGYGCGSDSTLLCSALLCSACMSIIISDYHWLCPIVATIYEILELMLRLFDAFFCLRLPQLLPLPLPQLPASPSTYDLLLLCATLSNLVAR